MPKDNDSKESRKRGAVAPSGSMEPSSFGAIAPWLSLDWVKSFLVALGLALFIRWVFAEPFRIPSGSMEPTLHGDDRMFHGDRVFVNKLIYGLRFPLNGTRIPWTKTRVHYADRRIWHGADPQRWDIVVFKAVLQEGVTHTTLVKRIVGLPGERVHIEDGRVWANGTPIDPPESLRDIVYYTSERAAFIDERREVPRLVLKLAKAGNTAEVLKRFKLNYYAKDYGEQIDRIRERLGSRDPERLSDDEIADLLKDLKPAGKSLTHQLLAMQQPMRSMLRYAVLPDDEYSLIPNDSYLVCGDNSGESADGRYFGWLPNEHILGRVSCIWWPIPRWRDFSGFSKTWWWNTLLAALGFLLVVRLLFGRFWRSHRQTPNGRIRADHLYINRWKFGCIIPFTRTKLFRGRSPRRGQLVLYRRPNPVKGEQDVFLGRVAGLPGERVYVDAGKLCIDGAPLNEPACLAERTYVSGDGVGPYGRSKGKESSLVPDGHFFILTESAIPEEHLDSRTLGWIPYDNLIGEASFTWWPPTRWGRPR